MQGLKFNDAVKSALQTIGFKIDSGDDTAFLHGEITLYLTAPVKGDLWLGISLPNNTTLETRLSRSALLEARPVEATDANW